MFFARYFQGVVEASQADFPCQLRLLFRYGRKDSSQIVNGIYVEPFYRVCYLLGISDVYQCRRTGLLKFSLRFRTGDVTGYYISLIILSEQHGKLRTYLAGSSYYQNVFHFIYG